MRFTVPGFAFAIASNMQHMRVQSWPCASPSRSSMPVPCVLNPLDANLGIRICDHLTACTRSDGGWCYTWSGVRGTVGVAAGTYRWTVRVLRSLPVELPQHPDGPDCYPAVRVGVSFPTTDVGMLGEAPGSWALSSTGSVAGDGGEPAVYARELAVGDTVRPPAESVKLTAALWVGPWGTLRTACLCIVLRASVPRHADPPPS